jgi:hypothetical protein
MEKEKNTQPHVTKKYHFEHVGQYIDYIHTQYVTIDKDAGIQIGEVQNQSTPQPATPSAPVSITPKKEGDELLDLLFLPDDQERDKTEALLGGILRGKSVKTKVLRELYQNRRYFNLDAMTHEDKAAVLTAWAKKLNLMQNFKGDAFTEKDFAAYC